MDILGILLMLIVGCLALMLFMEIFGDAIDTIFSALIYIAIVGGIVYLLWVKFFYPAYLSCRKFISDHVNIFLLIAAVAAVLVLLIILLRLLYHRYQLMTTDYTELIHRCDQDIANATKALAQARKAEENHRYSNEFEILEPGRHRYGYNPNRFEEEVEECENTLNYLKEKKRYYEEQKKKGDKLRRRRRKNTF